MYRLPDLTEIQKDLLLEFYKLSDTIAPTSERYIQLSKRHWDSIAKPLDSLGEFEKSSKNYQQYMKVKSLIFQTNVLL